MKKKNLAEVTAMSYAERLGLGTKSTTGADRSFRLISRLHSAVCKHSRPALATEIAQLLADSRDNIGLGVNHPSGRNINAHLQRVKDHSELPREAWFRLAAPPGMRRAADAAVNKEASPLSRTHTPTAADTVALPSTRHLPGQEASAVYFLSSLSLALRHSDVVCLALGPWCLQPPSLVLASLPE